MALDGAAGKGKRETLTIESTAVRGKNKRRKVGEKVKVSTVVVLL